MTSAPSDLLTELQLDALTDFGYHVIRVDDERAAKLAVQPSVFAIWSAHKCIFQCRQSRWRLARAP